MATPLTADQNASLDTMKTQLQAASTWLGTQGAPPQPTTPPATPPTINSGNTAPQQPILYQTPTPVATYPVGSLDTTVPTPPAPPTATETQANDLSGSLQKLNDLMTGKPADQNQAETDAGLPALQKTQNDLVAQLTGLQNEAKAIPLQLQNDATGRGITAAGLAPIQDAQLRENAIKALTVSTLLEATKGNIANAQAQADKVVAQKYDPIQAKIDAAKANLDLIMKSPQYTLDEKNRAQAQLDIQNARQAALDKAKGDSAAILKVATDAASNGADAITLQKITQAKTPAEALSIAGAAGSTKKLDTSVQVVNGQKVLINNQTGDTIKTLGPDLSAGGTATQKQSALASQFSNVFVPGGTFMGSGGKTPTLDENGNITLEAFKSALQDWQAKGYTRTDFLKTFGYLLLGAGNKISPNYGLTPVEMKLVIGTLT